MPARPPTRSPSTASAAGRFRRRVASGPRRRARARGCARRSSARRRPRRRWRPRRGAGRRRRCSRRSRLQVDGHDSPSGRVGDPGGVAGQRDVDRGAADHRDLPCSRAPSNTVRVPPRSSTATTRRPSVASATGLCPAGSARAGRAAGLEDVDVAVGRARDPQRAPGQDDVAGVRAGLQRGEDARRLDPRDHGAGRRVGRPQAGRCRAPPAPGRRRCARRPGRRRPAGGVEHDDPPAREAATNTRPSARRSRPDRPATESTSGAGAAPPDASARATATATSATAASAASGRRRGAATAALGSCRARAAMA